MEESIVQKKTAKLIQQELGTILQREHNYFPNVMLSIHVVRITKDLGLARIYLTAFPDGQLEEVADTLNEHQVEIRRALSARIRNKLRKMPEIRFYPDDSFRESQRINDLLDNLDIPSESDDSEENEN
ncbi:30S ribosome-binding factor RbfA [Pontibacter sp. G13]|uniref:30S ribosome-binding factor RbfA n=1 Tax=Pontibacter sp. G13 TaxID=3074898 RepID=UPI00288AF161|nr:30S ribosome-binding factor RbfA [Pontibacter sp. G13]WNJ18526.1 30S ribosome-binding factor RbfA [Pontibacter sp. G13]